MKNRDQVRAKNALEAIDGRATYRGIEGGDALSGFPALVISNGLLATLAFSKSKGQEYPKICAAVARHLADREIALIPSLPSQDDPVAAMDHLIKALTSGDSDLLRLCTAETLAYLNYLRRFVKARG